MTIKVVLEDVGAGKKMVPKCELPKSIPLHNQWLNFETNVCELEDHVNENGLSLN
jgi:hypothetical protein